MSALKNPGPDDAVFLLETDRETWIAMNGVDEEGRATRFRLAFTSLERAADLARRFPELGATRVREMRLSDITMEGDPPIALDVDPESLAR